VTVDRVLFDAPGPAGRRRIRIATVLTLVVLAAAVVVALKQFADHGELAADR